MQHATFGATYSLSFSQCVNVSYFILSLKTLEDSFKLWGRFGFCWPNFEANQTGHSLWETKYKIRNLSFFFLVIFGATLSRRFARQIFTSFFFFVSEGPDKVLGPLRCFGTLSQLFLLIESQKSESCIRFKTSRLVKSICQTRKNSFLNVCLMFKGWFLQFYH